MSNLVQKTDYSVGLALLLGQYWDSPKLKGIIDASYTRAEALELALFEIRDQFWLASCVGVQLDVIGDIFNVDRAGDADAAYRTRILYKSSLIASGEPEKIISILKNSFAATFVTYIPGWPAIPASYNVITDATIIIPQLMSYSPAGVQPYIIESLKFQDDTPIELQSGDFIYVNKQ